MYYFYMGSVLLPIPPDKFSLKITNANKTVTLVNEGEINILRNAGLTDLEFKVLIPAVEYPFAMYENGFKSPAYYTKHFESLKTSKKPFQFIVSRAMPNGKLLFDTNMKVSMEDYTIEEKSSEGFDLIVSINLKQHRTFGTKTVKVTDGTASVENQRDQTESPAPDETCDYTPEEGQSLYEIAKQFYGCTDAYVAIMEANKEKIIDPNFLSGSETLTLLAEDVVKQQAIDRILEKERSGANGRNRGLINSGITGSDVTNDKV